MNLITITAKTYDEAVTKALLELQTTSEHLHVEIVQKETSGLFGVLGGKSCIIKAGVMSEQEEAQFKQEEENKKKEAAKKAEQEAQEKAQQETAQPELSDELKEKIARQNEEIAKRRQAAQENQGDNNTEEASDDALEETRSSHIRPEREIKPISEEEAATLTNKAQEFLSQLFGAMKITVATEIGFDHTSNEMSILLTGEDMGILIGKRGQTLDSLQYITSLVVNKDHDGYIRIKMDTENYRQRREEKLTALANNIAHKVARTGEAVSLEPMNPYERRIIHSALQADKLVTTDSEGEDPYRHIVIKPVGGAKRGTSHGYGRGGYGHRKGGGHRARQ